MKSPSYRPNLSYTTKASDATREAALFEDASYQTPTPEYESHVLSNEIKHIEITLDKAKKAKESIQRMIRMKPVAIQDVDVIKAVSSITKSNNVKEITYDTYLKAKDIYNNQIQGKQRDDAHKIISTYEGVINDLLGFSGLEGLFIIDHIINTQEIQLSLITHESYLTETDEQREKFVEDMEQLEKQRVERHQSIQQTIRNLEQSLLLEEDEANTSRIQEEIQVLLSEKNTLESAMKTTAELSYLSFKKAEDAESIIEETYHLAHYTIQNHFGGTLDCIIEAIVDTLISKDFSLQFTKLDETIRLFTMARSFIGFRFIALNVDIDEIENRIRSQIPPWAQRPDREILRMMFRLQDTLTLPLFRLLKDIGNTHGDYSRSRLIQCFPLAELAEMLTDQLLKAEKQSKQKMMNMFQYHAADKKDSLTFVLRLTEKDRFRKLYQVLGTIIEFLELLQSQVIIPNEFLQKEIQEFLRKRGAYTYYDAQKDEIIYV